MAKIRKFGSLIASSIFLSVLFNNALAQSNYYEDNPRTFYGGVVFGGNFTQVDGDNYAGYRKVGLNAGGIVYVQMAEHIAPSLEILYSQKGAHGHKAQPSNSRAFDILKYDIKLNYAEIPVMLNYFDKRKSHFGAGFSYSQLISSKETATTNNVKFNDTMKFDRYPFKKMDLNFVIGGQLHLVKGLFLNVRFQYSLVPVRKKIFPEFGRAEQYNNAWVMRLMYLF